MLPSLSLFVSFSASVIPSQQDVSSTPGTVLVESRVERAALFKNGLAFVTRMTDVPAGTHELRFLDLPAAAHGSCWWKLDASRVSLGRAVARRELVPERAPIRSLEEMLRANVGQTVGLTLKDGLVPLGDARGHAGGRTRAAGALAP